LPDSSWLSLKQNLAPNSIFLSTEKRQIQPWCGRKGFAAGGNSILEAESEMWFWTALGMALATFHLKD